MGRRIEDEIASLPREPLNAEQDKEALLRAARPDLVPPQSDGAPALSPPASAPDARDFAPSPQQALPPTGEASRPSMSQDEAIAPQPQNPATATKPAPRSQGTGSGSGAGAGERHDDSGPGDSVGEGVGRDTGDTGKDRNDASREAPKEDDKGEEGRKNAAKGLPDGETKQTRQDAANGDANSRSEPARRDGVEKNAGSETKEERKDASRPRREGPKPASSAQHRQRSPAQPVRQARLLQHTFRRAHASVEKGPGPPMQIGPLVLPEALRPRRPPL